MSDIQLSAPGAVVPPGGRTLGRGLLLVMLTVGMVMATVQLLFAPDHLSPVYISGCVFLALVTCILMIVYRATGFKPVNWLSVEIIFIVMLFLVHFWYPLSWLMGATASTDKVWINEAIVCKATMIAAIGLIAFCIGFHLPRDRFHVIRRASYLDGAALFKLKAGGNIVFFVGMFFALLFLILRPSQARYYETGGYSQGLVFVLGIMGIQMGGLLLTIAGARLYGKWRIGTVAKCVSVLYVLMALIEGYRSPVALVVLTVAAAYSEYIKHISFKKIVVVIVSALIVLGIVGVGRHARERSLSGFMSAVSESKELSWRSGIDSLGASVNCLYLAVDTVPSRYPFFHGVLQGSQMVTAIPWSSQLFPWALPEFGSSSIFFTWLKDPNMGSGAGSTIIADMYIEFGTPSVFVEMFLLGMMFKYIQQKARATDGLIWNVAHATLIPTAAILVRNQTLMLLRDVGWPVVGVLLMTWVMGIPRRAAQPRP
ncbi:MAG: O-antigen ligase [Planctomycetota bacterium]|nr:O-antigen ligase [Planctomycetota bacterium]